MDFEKEILRISQFFIDDFKSAYFNIKKQGKTKILDNFYSIYRKWYYSAFFDQNILTPAHIVYRMNEKEGLNNYYVPVAKIKSKSRFNGFDIKILNYTTDNHPIIEDLKIFIDYAKIVTINQGGLVCDDDINKILKLISMNDKFYLEYLLRIGEKLKIFKKMPSIHSEVYCAGKNYHTFFENDGRICFDKVMKAAIDFSCEMLNDFFFDEQKFFSYDYLESIIKNPIPIEEIFKDIYDLVGINIEEFWLNDEPYGNSDFEEFTDMILSSAFFLKVMLDKWFLIPFGDYLKVVMPIYTFPYDFSQKMNEIIDELAVDRISDFSAALYYPCSRYYVTPVAFDYFNIKKNYYDEYKKIFDKIPMNIVIDTITIGIKDRELLKVENEFDESSSIYEMKIRFKDQKDFWKVLEVDSSDNLNLFHMEICKVMNLYPFGDYSFFTDTNMTPFSEYTPKSKEKRYNKKTENTKLLDLRLEIKQKFIYRHSMTRDALFFETSGNVIIEIEFLKIKAKKKNDRYPRVTRISNLAKYVESKFEF